MGLILWAIIIWVGYYMFKAGKRTGSHQGYAAGRYRRRR